METHAITPWLAHRDRKQVCDTIVLHATAGATASGAIATLRQKGFSYHYLIEDQRETDGRIIKCVPYSKVAYHAGKSVGPHGANVNNYSVGISFVNANTGSDPYSLRQVSQCKELILELRKAMPTLKYITTHAIISPGRKTDPKGFPIEVFADEVGLQLWEPKVP